MNAADVQKIAMHLEDLVELVPLGLTIKFMIPGSENGKMKSITLSRPVDELVIQVPPKSAIVKPGG